MCGASCRDVCLLHVSRCEAGVCVCHYLCVHLRECSYHGFSLN